MKCDEANNAQSTENNLVDAAYQCIANSRFPLKFDVKICT